MEHLELCGLMDQHEPLHSHLYAGQLTDRWRHELVAGDSDYFFRQCDRTHSHDPEWPGRREVRHLFPRFCTRQFWRAGCEHTCHTACDCCLWLVRHTNLDRGLRPVP